MSGRTQLDSYLVTPIPCNGVKVAWTKARRNGVPTDNFQVVDGHAISLYKHPEHSWILKSVLLANSTTATLDEGIKFLELEKDQVEWKKLQRGGFLPHGTIRCEEVGTYGNMYIGKTDQDGIGMVVVKNANDDEADDNDKLFVYMTLKENHMITRKEGFAILCAVS